jgi:hypothetical protein
MCVLIILLYYSFSGTIPSSITWAGLRSRTCGFTNQIFTTLNFEKHSQEHGLRTATRLRSQPYHSHGCSNWRFTM